MELRHARYFIAVVEEGSFVAAARRLHLSQPPLSRQIQSLEEELGVVLLERGRRGVQPTPAGQAFYEGARRLLGDAERLTERTRRVAGGEAGCLRVATSQSGAWLMVEVLRRLRAERPGVELEPSELRAAEQARALLRGDVDVTLGYRLPALEHERIRVTELFTDRLLLAVPESGWRQDVRALSALPLLTMPVESAPSLRAAVLTGLNELGVTPSEVRGFAAVQTVLTLVGCGVGFGVVPESIARAGAPGVRFVAPRRWKRRLSTCAFTAVESALTDRFLVIARQVAAERRSTKPR